MHIHDPTVHSAGMATVHLTPNLEASNAMAGFFFALVNVFCGFLRTYPVG